jgi:hypothetical protein
MEQGMVGEDAMSSPTVEHNTLFLPYLLNEDNGRWREHAKCKGQPELLPL